jgi:hypothetical protein
MAKKQFQQPPSQPPFGKGKRLEPEEDSIIWTREEVRKDIEKNIPKNSR